MADETLIRTKSWLEIIREEQPRLIAAIKAELSSNEKSWRFFQMIIAYLDGRRWINVADDSVSDINPARIMGRQEEVTDILELFETFQKVVSEKEDVDHGR